MLGHEPIRIDFPIGNIMVGRINLPCPMCTENDAAKWAADICHGGHVEPPLWGMTPFNVFECEITGFVTKVACPKCEQRFDVKLVD